MEKKSIVIFGDSGSGKNYIFNLIKLCLSPQKNNFFEEEISIPSLKKIEEEEGKKTIKVCEVETQEREYYKIILIRINFFFNAYDYDNTNIEKLLITLRKILIIYCSKYLELILFIKNGARWLLFDVLSFNVIKSIISSEKFFKNNFVTICNSFRKSFLDDNESSEWISNLKKTQPKDFNNDSEIYILLNDDFSDKGKMIEKNKEKVTELLKKKRERYDFKKTKNINCSNIKLIDKDFLLVKNDKKIIQLNFNNTIFFLSFLLLVIFYFYTILGKNEEEKK